MIVRAIKALWRYLAIKKDPVCYARKMGARIGDNVRLIGFDYRTFGSEPYLVSIGNNVTITGQTRIITHDGAVSVFREKEPDIELCRPVVIGDNVFIGFRSIILSGVTIGNNVIIGAGSVVTTDIPDNSVAAGTPAKVIRTLDEYRNKIDPLVIKRTWSNEEEKRDILSKMFR